MKFQIPFTILDIEIAKRKSKYFLKFTTNKETKLSEFLKNAQVDIDKRSYQSIMFRSFVINILVLTIIITSILGAIPLLGFDRIDFFYFYGLGIALLISGFVFMNQYNYPKIYSLNKTRNIEKYLIPVLQDMLVQLNSGVPLFRILVNISSSDYGEVSTEFKRIVAEINSGTPHISAIEKYGKLNTSEYFRRVLWQVSNGMRAGSDMHIVLDEEAKNLSKEQAIQIQTYGNKLNPLIMFYMIIAVIMPSLGITFLIIISSMLGLGENLIKLLLIVIFFFVMFTQIMFIGLIKSRRPTLL